MAKIAVLFLLVALVAVSSGYRLARESPAAPTPNIEEILKPFVDQANQAFSEEKQKELLQNLQKLGNTTVSVGNDLIKNASAWIQKTVEEFNQNLQNQKAAAPK